MTVASKVVPIRPQPFDYLKSRPFYVFDTETTGLDNKAEVVEFAMVDGLSGDTLINTLVKPVGQMSPGAERVHGISMEMLDDAPDWLEVEAQIRTISKGKTGVAYNANFDLRLMVQSANLRGQKTDITFGFDQFFCAMIEYSKRAKLLDFFRKQPKWIKLTNACQAEGVDINVTAHRALADTQLTQRLIKKILMEQM